MQFYIVNYKLKYQKFRFWNIIFETETANFSGILSILLSFSWCVIDYSAKDSSPSLLYNWFSFCDALTRVEITCATSLSHL